MSEWGSGPDNSASTQDNNEEAFQPAPGGQLACTCSACASHLGHTFLTGRGLFAGEVAVGGTLPAADWHQCEPDAVRPEWAVGGLCGSNCLDLYLLFRKLAFATSSLQVVSSEMAAIGGSYDLNVGIFSINCSVCNC